MRATTLMLGIEEAISKTNGDGLDTGLPQNPDRIAHRGLVERGFARQKGATTQLFLARRAAVHENLTTVLPPGCRPATSHLCSVAQSTGAIGWKDRRHDLGTYSLSKPDGRFGQAEE